MKSADLWFEVLAVGVVGYWDCWLLGLLAIGVVAVVAVGCWLLAVGCWLLLGAVGRCCRPGTPVEETIEFRREKLVHQRNVAKVGAIESLRHLSPSRTFVISHLRHLSPSSSLTKLILPYPSMPLVAQHVACMLLWGLCECVSELLDALAFSRCHIRTHFPPFPRLI
jgi:hypothetical protein